MGRRRPPGRDERKAQALGVDLQNDFADVAARLHEAMGGRRFLERKNLVDDRARATSVQYGPDALEERGGDGTLLGPRARPHR